MQTESSLLNLRGMWEAARSVRAAAHRPITIAGAHSIAKVFTNMCVIVNWTLHFQQGQIIFECGRVVFAMHNDALDVLGDGALLLQIARNVELAEHGNQRGQESVYFCFVFIVIVWKM